MLSQIKALLNDAQLRQQIKKATRLEEAIALIKTAGIQKGYQFSNNSLSQLFQSHLEPLGEEDLLSVAGGAQVPTSDCQSWGCQTVEDF